MNKRLKLATKILIAVCFIGLAILAYPKFANYWNESHSTKMIAGYSDALNKLSEDKNREMWTNAVKYNQEIASLPNQRLMSVERKQQYEVVLNVDGNGVMGFIDIPKIGVSLPLYHGTSSNVLQVAVGHIEWTSLPVGGVGTHCAVSGHRGLPSAKLFTDLNKLREQDTFTINVLNQVLTYEVDQIRTVLPNETDGILIEEGMDYCTLITCTPYGINTHRLLVRGHRIENTQKGATVISEAVLVDQLIVAFYLAVPLIFILFMKVMLTKPPKKKPAVIIPKEESKL